MNEDNDENIVNFTNELISITKCIDVFSGYFKSNNAVMLGGVPSINDNHNGINFIINDLKKLIIIIHVSFVGHYTNGACRNNMLQNEHYRKLMADSDSLFRSLKAHLDGYQI